MLVDFAIENLDFGAKKVLDLGIEKVVEKVELFAFGATAKNVPMVVLFVENLPSSGNIFLLGAEVVI